MTGVAIGVAAIAGTWLGWPLAIALAFGVLATLLAAPPSFVRVAAVAVLIACCLGAWRSAPPPRIVAGSWIESAEGLRGTVASVPDVGGRVQQFVIQVEAYRSGEDWSDASGRICGTAPAATPIGLGDRVALSGRISRLDDLPVAVQDYFRWRGCEGGLYAFAATILAPGGGWQRSLSWVRLRLGEVLEHSAPGDAGALLNGLVTGDDQRLSEERRNAFVRTGTSHVTAVSGANLALVVAFLASAGHVFGVGRRLAWQLVVVGGVWTYALLVGLGAPALRAALVTTAAVLAARVGRRPDFVTLIVLAGAAMVVVRPADLWTLSFQLSFASSLALAAVLGGSGLGSGGGSWLVPAAAATMTAQLATLPVLLPTFGSVSLAGTPANLLIAVPVEVAFPLAALASVAGAVWLPAGEALASPARIAAEVVLRVVDAGVAFPASVLPVGVPPLAASWLLAAGVACAVVLANEDGRRWARRAPDDLRAVPPRLRLAGVGILAGAALAIVGAAAR